MKKQKTNKYQTHEAVPANRDPRPYESRPARVYDAPRCVNCGGTKLTVTDGSYTDGRGYRVRRCTCADCGFKQVVILK